jgi:thioredoxin reductase
MHELVIIGGAAGLSAALYALGKGLDAVTIYEDVGGKAGTQQQLAGHVLIAIGDGARAAASAYKYILSFTTPRTAAAEAAD